MITTEFYKGQGFGNQLWVYAVLRTIAIENNYQFGIQSPNRFKGTGFIDLDFGRKVIGVPGQGPNILTPLGIDSVYFEKQSIHLDDRFNITGFDIDVLKVSDKTKIGGYFQSEIYIHDHASEISNWFKHTNPIISPENLCLISFRGGEYLPHKDLMLEQNYYWNAMSYIKSVNRDIEFGVVTEDPELARLYFPELHIFSELPEKSNISRKNNVDGRKVSRDFGLLQNAKYLILSNSSFSWWGAWTNKRVTLVIAPKYWARHNADNGYWSPGDSLTSNWYWLDKGGAVSSYDVCLRASQRFMEKEGNKSKVLYVDTWWKTHTKWVGIKSKIYRWLRLNSIR